MTEEINITEQTELAIGSCLNKNNYTVEKYTYFVQWCNQNDCHLQEGENFFEIVANTHPQMTYQQKRAFAYPSIPEQLDMIYWDKVNGTNLWQNKINEIKNKYPKE